MPFLTHSLRQVVFPDTAGRVGASGLVESAPTFRTYRVEIDTEYESVAARWERMAEGGAATGFQRRHWLAAWYGTLGREPGIEPLLVSVADATTGADVAAFPLVLRRTERGLRIIEPADADMTDYNAPILAAAAPTSAEECGRLLGAVFDALPPADLFAARKMPCRIGGRPNPFVSAGWTVFSDAIGHPLDLGPDLSDWEAGLSKKTRGDLRRKWKIIRAMPNSRLRIAADAVEAKELYEALETAQAERIEHLGLPYLLAEPPFRAFYRRLALDRFSPERIVLAVLEVEGQPLAAAMGLREDSWVGITRLAMANAREEMQRLSPGILLADGLIRALHQRGALCVDFTTGDYDYKRRLGTTQQRLFDCYRALSWRGTPKAAVLRLRQRAKSDPRVHAMLRRLAGRG